MTVIGLDLGGTKIASAVFSESGRMFHKQTVTLDKRQGHEVGALIKQQLRTLQGGANSIDAIGISVPGIYHQDRGKVWAPNIPGWEDYPLLSEIRSITGAEKIKISIDSDRACYILGESWRGAARGCKDAIFLAVGTGIGAGIMINGNILRGHHDVAGAVGWLALEQPFRKEYESCGCFEYHASGEGVARVAREMIKKEAGYAEKFGKMEPDKITSYDVFRMYEEGDPIAKSTLENAVIFWGMAIANLVSLFNPEKIILGGGLFGPAGRFLEQIKKEAKRWAQPVAIRQVTLEISALGGDAGLVGAARLAMLSSLKE